MFKKILAFVAVAESGSFTAASKKLNVAQPWLSTQVRRLEDMLGFDLLIRTKRAVELTPEGRALLPICQTMDQNYGEFKNIADTFLRRKSGQLTIACEASTIHDALRYDVIDRFIKSYPNVSIKCFNEEARCLFRDLVDQRVDIIYAPLPASDDRMESVTLSRHEIVLLVPEEHSLARRDNVCAADIAGMEILTGNRDFSTSCNPEQAGMFSGISWVEPPETEYESRYHMVQMLGIPSLWINYPGQPHRLPAGLRIVPFEKPMYCSFGFAKLRGNDERPLRQFMSLVAGFASRNVMSMAQGAAAVRTGGASNEVLVLN